MPSVVRELQRDCLDPKVRVSDLLRKALVVARKLGLTELETWVSHELNGYPQEAEPPPYRDLPGQVRAWNPERGWIPVRFSDPKWARLFSSRKTNQAVAGLEALVDGDPEGILAMPFPPEIEKQVLTEPFLSNLSLRTSPAAIHTILDAVRNAVLNWTLKLEEDGVVGEGLSFSEEERRAVSSVAYHNVNNFFGPVGHSQIAQSSTAVEQTQTTTFDPKTLQTFVTNVRAAIPDLQIDPTARDELDADVQTLDSQARSPKPKLSIIRESLGSVRRILESAAGSVAAALVRQAMGLGF
jgi:hypothetical protein